MIVVDADVLGRGRTGDETYVANLLRALGEQKGDLRIGAITRDASLVPAGIEPLVLTTGSQELRMAWSVARLLRRVKPRLVHFVHALPLGLDAPAVLTVQDLSFERDRALMGGRTARSFVGSSPARCAARRACSRSPSGRSETSSSCTTLRGTRSSSPRSASTRRSARAPTGGGPTSSSWGRFSSARTRSPPPRPRRRTGCSSWSRPEKDASLASELRLAGADVRGYVPKEELAQLYRGAAALVLPSRYEGFGLPVVEAMASGTPVVAAPDEALREVAGDAAVFAEPSELGGAVRAALDDRERLAAAGLERARLFTWEATARRTLDVYRELL